jgi:ATP-dependent helicase/nuclease subunit A
LSGFLHWLRRTNPEIKRDMEHGRDEVRVMTVHGAKGLEAPIVFLPDTCSAGSGRGAADLLRLPPATPDDDVPEAYVWPVKGTSGHPELRRARAAATDADKEERNRLLYVAMTRARDRLYVAGYEPRSGRPSDCWYEQIREALEPLCEKTTAADGGPALRLASAQTAPTEGSSSGEVRAVPIEALPLWATRDAPREPVVVHPLTPSRSGSFEVDALGEPIEAPHLARGRGAALPSPLALREDLRFLRGTMTHALLEHLPAIDAAQRKRAADRFVALRGVQLPAQVREEIVSETLAILQNREFAPLFGPTSRAEVPIAAEIADPEGRRPHLRIIGQIDRLVHLGHEILILDYKTNRPPPSEPRNVPAAFIQQLAAYCLVVNKIFPGLGIRAAILWTDGPRLMPIPSSMIDEHQKRLWERMPGLP